MTELQQYIETQNAKWVAECEARGATFYTTTVSDPEHWAEYGIYTVEQYQKYQLAVDIAESAKTAYGRKHWVDYENMSMQELEDLADSYGKSAEEQIRYEEQMEQNSVEEFKSLIQSTIEIGAGDEETALRWLTQDEEFYSSQCVESWVWDKGILFTDYGRELVNRLLGVVSYKEYEAA